MSASRYLSLGSLFTLVLLAGVACKVDRAKPSVKNNGQTNETGLTPETNNGNLNNTPVNPDVPFVATPGKAVVTSAIPVGDAQCPQGGAFIESFSDTNQNGKFDAATEKDYETKRICNGLSGGVTTSTSQIPSGDNRCIQGGVLVQTYSDVNQNSVYEASTDKDLRETVICNTTQSPWNTVPSQQQQNPGQQQQQSPGQQQQQSPGQNQQQQQQQQFPSQN